MGECHSPTLFISDNSSFIPRFSSERCKYQTGSLKILLLYILIV